MKTIAVIPTYQEAKHISHVVRLARKYVDIVLVTDDNSDDATRNLAIEAGARVTLNDKHARGYGSNIWHGIREARKFHPDAYVILDGDGQHDPNEIPLLLSPLFSGADVVTGCRVNGHGMPSYRRLGNRCLSFICNAGARQTLPDALSGFWAVRASAMPKLTEKKWGLCIELLVKARASGSRLVGVPVRPIYHDNYSENSTTTPLKLGWALLKTIVKWRVRCEVLTKNIFGRQRKPIDNLRRRYIMTGDKG